MIFLGQKDNAILEEIEEIEGKVINNFMEFKNFLNKQENFQIKLLKIFECCGKNFNKVWDKEILPVIFEVKYNNKEQLVDLILEKIVVLKEDLSDSQKQYVNYELLNMIKPEFSKELLNAGKAVQHTIYQKEVKGDFNHEKATHALLAIKQLYTHLIGELNNFDSSKIAIKAETSPETREKYFSRYHGEKQKWQEEQKFKYNASQLGHRILGMKEPLFNTLINQIAEKEGKVKAEVGKDIAHQLISKGKIERGYEDFRELFIDLTKAYDEEKGFAKLGGVKNVIKNYLTKPEPKTTFSSALPEPSSSVPEREPMTSSIRSLTHASD